MAKKTTKSTTKTKKDTKSKADELAATKLPSPVTVTGSAYGESDKNDSTKPKKSATDDDVSSDDDDTKDSDDENVLPMPAVFGDEDSENEDEDEKKENKAVARAYATDSPSDDRSKTIKTTADDDREPEEKENPSQKDQKFGYDESETETDTLADTPKDTEPDESLTPSPSVKSAETTTDTPKQDHDNEDDDKDDFHIPALSAKPADSPPPTQPTVSSTFPAQVPSVSQSPTVNPSQSVVQTQSMQADAPKPFSANSTQETALSDTMSAPKQFDDDAIYDSNQSSGGSGVVKKIMLGLAATVIGGGIVVGGYFGFRQFFTPQNEPEQAVLEESTATPRATATPKPSITPSPTPEPLDRSKVKITVLNGTGVPGAAGEAQKILEDAGFEDVDTGNADNYDYTNTQINYKADFQDYVDLVIDDLGSNYKTVKGEELDDSDDYDLAVILGPASSSADEDPEATSSADTQ